MGNPYLFLLGRIPHMFVGERESFTLIFAHCREGGRPEETTRAMDSLLMAAAEHMINRDAGGRR
jgi:hypothetical protein